MWCDNFQYEGTQIDQEVRTTFSVILMYQTCSVGPKVLCGIAPLAAYGNTIGRKGSGGKRRGTVPDFDASRRRSPNVGRFP